MTGMAEDIPSSDQLEDPRFTASGVWRGSVEIAPIAAFVIPAANCEEPA